MKSDIIQSVSVADITPISKLDQDSPKYDETFVVALKLSTINLYSTIPWNPTVSCHNMTWPLKIPLGLGV